MAGTATTFALGITVAVLVYAAHRRRARARAAHAHGAPPMHELVLRQPPSRDALLLAAAACPRERCVRVRPPAGAAPFVLITCPTLARRVCESGVFERDLTAYERYRPFLGGSLLLQRGAEHTRARAALRPIFSDAHVRAALPELRRCCARLCAALVDAQARSPLRCVPICAVHRLAQLFALEVSETLLGRDGGRSGGGGGDGGGGGGVDGGEGEAARAAARRAALRTVALFEELQAIAAEADATAASGKPLSLIHI